MKNIIKLEELAMLAICVIALYTWKVDWWLYLLMFLGPDISMLGYLFGNKTGAFSYNLFHHKGVAVVLFAIGLYYDMDIYVFAGIILFGHSSLDRMLGYGLKYNEGFKFTHLDSVGKKD